MLLYVYKFNQYKYHTKNYSTLLYKRKVQNSAHVDMPRDLQLLLPDVVF